MSRVNIQHVASAGKAFLESGDFIKAEQQFKLVLRHVPGNPDILSALGEANIGLDRIKDAMSLFRQALKRDPNHFYSLVRGAYCTTRLNRPDEAVPLLERALTIAPGDDDLMNNLGSCLFKIGRGEDALAWMRRACAANPRNVNALLNLAQSCGVMRRDAEARAAFERLKTIDPANREVDRAYGMFLHTRDRLAARTALLASGAAAADPDVLAALIDVEATLAEWGSLESNIAALRDMLARGATVEPQEVVFDFDDQNLALWNARNYCEAHFPPAPGIIRTSFGKSGPIRVGYLSADFREHPMGYLFAGVPERHDRSKVEPVALLTRNDASPVRDRILRGCASSVDLSYNGDGLALAEAIAAERIDILVDLGGHMGGARQDALRFKPARVIVNWAGFANTTGSTVHDYIIADRFVAPPGSEHLFSEKVVRLPHVYLCHDDRRASPFGILQRRHRGLNEHAFVFGFFNNIRKLRPAMFQAWLDLLKATPDSVIWMLVPEDATRNALRAHAAAGGVDSARLIFADYVGQEEHLARLPLVDLVLDTAPCGAHTSATDCLWMGVPIVTIDGDSMPARICGSLLRNVGQDGLIARDFASYKTLALELAHDRDRLARIRAELAAARGHAPLFDTAGFVRDLESAFEEMAGRARKGLKAVSFDVAAGA